jgi:hypothetical protein
VGINRLSKYSEALCGKGKKSVVRKSILLYLENNDTNDCVKLTGQAIKSKMSNSVLLIAYTPILSDSLDIALSSERSPSFFDNF